MSFIKGREIPITITFVVGILMIISYYFGATIPTIKTMSTIVQKWAVIVAAFALILGLINITRIHVNHLIKRTKGQWPYSILLLSVMYIMLILGLIGGTKNPGYNWLYTYIFLPVDATMYSSLAFFIASAAYRAFRARNIEAVILLVSGTIVMLMNAPIGNIIWGGFPIIGKWIMKIPTVAAQRAFLICVAIGTISLGIRILMGLERGYLGGGEE